MRTKLQKIFKEVFETNVVPLNLLPNNTFRISNIVCKVELLLENESIDLEYLSLYLNGMTKFKPKNFAATIVRIKDVISTTTCLVFRSGKLVVVGGKTIHHVLYACHMYRSYLENVNFIFDKHVATLENRTCFNGWGIQNIVGSDNLHCTPNLKTLAEHLPEVSNCNPELFPALIILFWVKNKSACRCEKKKNVRSCKCNCGVLIFDTGKFVVSGCTTIEDFLYVKNIIYEIFETDKFYDKEPETKNRFSIRREKLFMPDQIEFVGWKNDNSMPIFDTMIDRLFNNLKKQTVVLTTSKKKIPTTTTTTNIELFLLDACLLNEIENVKHILSYDKRFISEALKHKHKYTDEMVELLEREVLLNP